MEYVRDDVAPPGSRATFSRYSWLKNRFEAAPDRAYAVVDEVQKIADEHGRPMSQFALRWTMAHPAVIAPLIGPRSIAQLEDCLAALEWQIDPAALRRIDELVPPGTDLLFW